MNLFRPEGRSMVHNKSALSNLNERCGSEPCVRPYRFIESSTLRMDLRFCLRSASSLLSRVSRAV